MSIVLIAGLGNPGPNYRDTRHNLGFVLIDALAREWGASWKIAARFQAQISIVNISGNQIALLKPQSFMNRSGRVLGAYCRYYKIPAEKVAVIYDEINIDLGSVKVNTAGSAGGHNGVEDVLQHLGNGFSRFRIGIGPKYPKEIAMTDFVLGKLSANERTVIQEKLPEFLTGLKLLVDRGPVIAMNQINTQSQKKSDESEPSPDQ